MTAVSGRLLPLALALVMIAPAGVHARWQGIAETDSRIVYTGRALDGYRAVYRHRPFAESAYKNERYLATWGTGGRRLPVLQLHLTILAPGRHFPRYMQSDPVKTAKSLSWFRNRTLAVGETGAAATAPGKTDYVVFTAGEDRCALFKGYFEDGSIDDLDTLGNVMLSGLYCPTGGAVDAGALESVLARIGVRGIAVPGPEAADAAAGAAPPASGKPPDESAADMVAAGDMRAMRRALARGLDPDTVVAFSHSRFARGRTIRAPMLMAAAVHGHTEMVVLLLARGASTRGPASGAICAAVAGKRLDVVAALLEKDAELARYGRCGRGRNRTALQVAMRLGHLDIAETLQQAESR